MSRRNTGIGAAIAGSLLLIVLTIVLNLALLAGAVWVVMLILQAMGVL